MKIFAFVFGLILVSNSVFAAAGDYEPKTQSANRTAGITFDTNPGGVGTSIEFNLFTDDSFFAQLKRQVTFGLNRADSISEANTNGVSNHLDERDFLAARKILFDPIADANEKYKHDLTGLNLGDEIQVLLYLHNNAEQKCTANPPLNTATNVITGLDWSGITYGANNTIDLQGSITADNAVPGTINDTVGLTFAGDYTLETDVVARTYRTDPDGTPDGTACGSTDTGFTSVALTHTAANPLNLGIGNIDGSYGNINYISYRMSVVPVDRSFTVDIVANPVHSSTIDYAGSTYPQQIVYTATATNTGNVPISGVDVCEVIPAGLEYVTGDAGVTYTSGTRTVCADFGTIAYQGSEVLNFTLQSEDDGIPAANLCIQLEGTADDDATVRTSNQVCHNVEVDPALDYDTDGLTNGFEVNESQTDPFDNDSDSAGTVPDENDNTINDNLEDLDNDGLTNLEEQTAGTDPLDDDSDDDTLKDGFEVKESFTDPNDTDSDSTSTTPDENDNTVLDPNEDLDNDGLTNAEEQTAGTDPLDDDSDDDTLKDGFEVKESFTDPLDTDSDSTATTPDENDNTVLDPDEDLDGDGFTNAEEQTAGTDPLVPNGALDSDGDGLTDDYETTVTFTDPFDADSNSTATTPDENDDGIDDGDADFDNDGLTNIQEQALGTDPLDADSDDDTLTDGFEVNSTKTDPQDTDSDSTSTTPDENDNTVLDPDEDLDGDGLSNFIEQAKGTDPLDPDSDDDTLTDGFEVTKSFTDPLDTDSDSTITTPDENDNTILDPNEDLDGDGLSNVVEQVTGTDPNDSDSDDDGLLDGEEIGASTDPLDPDSDDDTLLDGFEVKKSFTDPLDTDSDSTITTPDENDNTILDPNEDLDSDGLTNLEEQAAGTDPLDDDSDDDTLKDGFEVKESFTDPLDTDSDSTATTPDENDNTILDPDEDLDGDGFTNTQEQANGTDPLVDDSALDSDSDGLTDIYEITVTFTDPFDNDSDSTATTPDENDDGIQDGAADFDNDGLTNIQEQSLGTDPLDADSDDDTLTDGFEVNSTKTNPLDTDSDSTATTPDENDNSILDPNEDLDNDGLTNVEEQTAGTDPLDPDSDDDTLKDGFEIKESFTDPLDTDSDSTATTPDENDNGILDPNEDFDNDGFTNLQEQTNGTDPLVPNSSGGGGGGGGSSSSSGGGGSAPTISTIGVCSRTLNGAPQCINMRPHRRSNSWGDYLNCRSLGNAEAECAYQWAMREGHKPCAQTGILADSCATRPIQPTDVIVPGTQCRHTNHVDSILRETSIAKYIYNDKQDIPGFALEAPITHGEDGRYKVSVALRIQDYNTYKIGRRGDVRVNIYDYTIPAESALIWHRDGIENKTICNGSATGNECWEIRDAVSGGKIYTRVLTNDEIYRINQGNKVEVSLEYEMGADFLFEETLSTQLSNVAFATVEFAYDEILSDDSVVERDRFTYEVAGDGSSCGASISDLYMAESTLGARADLLLVRPRVRAVGLSSLGTIHSEGQEGLFSSALKGSVFNQVQDDSTIEYYKNLIFNAGKIPGGTLIDSKIPETETAVYHIDSGNVQITGDIDMKGTSKTFIIEGNDLEILSDFRIKNGFAGFIVLGGDIIIDDYVKEIEGIFITKAIELDRRVFGGVVRPADQKGKSSLPLIIAGSIVGDLNPLDENRVYIGEYDSNNNFVERPSIVSIADVRMLEDTPPGLEQTKGTDWAQEQ